MSTEPDNVVRQLLRDMRGDMAGMRAEVATKADIADLRSEMHLLRADVASDFIEVRRGIAGVCKDLGEQIVGFLRAVAKYHTSVIGHGIVSDVLVPRRVRVPCAAGRRDGRSARSGWLRRRP